MIMVTLVFRRSENSNAIGDDTVHGAYLLQSGKDQTQFRIGIAGQRDRGTLASRLRLHLRAKANPANWTTGLRPWSPLWTLEVLGGTGLCMSMIEHLLYATLAARYAFVSDSGFTAPAADAEAIRDIVEGQTDRIAELVQVQLGRRPEIIIQRGPF